MGTSKKLRAAAPAAILLVDIAAVVIFYHHIPNIVRPFDVLTAGMAVLGVATALLVRWNVVRCLALVLASLGGVLFALEMGQKYFNILGMADSRSDDEYLGEGAHRWRRGDPASYLAAKEGARRDGIAPEALADHFAGDVIAAKYPGRGMRSRQAHTMYVQEIEALKPIYELGGPLGYEPTPDNVERVRVTDFTSRVAVDCLNSVDEFGLRETECTGEADEAYLFLGCSFTFGTFLNDDETLPYHLSRTLGFGKTVLNLGVSGWGPNNVLRDLELDRRPARTGIDPATVKAVVYTLIDDHVNRLEARKVYSAPYYVLEGDRPVFKLMYVGSSFVGRLWSLLDKSRIYSGLRDRLAYRSLAGDASYNWRITVAMLAEIDRICRERYRTPLTVLYWDDNAEVVAMLRDKGLECLPVGDAFDEGADWRRMAIKYFVFDGHPSSYANKKLAEYLGRVVRERKAM